MQRLKLHFEILSKSEWRCFNWPKNISKTEEKLDARYESVSSRICGTHQALERSILVTCYLPPYYGTYQIVSFVGQVRRRTKLPQDSQSQGAGPVVLTQSKLMLLRIRPLLSNIRYFKFPGAIRISGSNQTVR